MKRCNKNFALILIMSVVFLFSGCSNIRLRTFKDDDEPNQNIESNSDNNNDIDASDNSGDTDKEVKDKDYKDDKKVDILKSDEETPDADNPAPTVIQPIENTELMVYVVNSSEQLEPVYALVPADTKITPQLIVDTVVDSMADRSLMIGVESVTTRDDTVIVSFYSDKPPLTGVGSGFEISILDAIAQSLTENLEDYNKVIYRVEGGPYRSGHIELGPDEVYFEDK